jgi:hypothetical protein
MLLEHPGDIVTREELRARLWPADTFVDFDHGLNKAINKLRDALGDSAESPRFVETVARRGYRFLADVKGADAPPAGDPQPAAPIASRTPRAPARGWKLAMFGLFVLLAALATWKVLSGNRPSTVVRSLAVLPLESLSSDASQDYFADGMTDELITDLGQIRALRVISRTSVMVLQARPQAGGPDRPRAERGRRGGGHRAALRRPGPHHRPADRRRGGQTPVVPELRG